MATPPQAASRHYVNSALMAQRAVTESRTAAKQGTTAVVSAIALHQAAQAAMSQNAVADILAEQSIDQAAEAVLNAFSFTTSEQAMLAMLDSVGYAQPSDLSITESYEFERLVASLVQDAGRAAEQVSVATRTNVGWVRKLTPPSCSRCVVLAGRVYRWSDGFMRHPQDDCVTIPVAEGDERLVVDPLELVRKGQVRGLSKADIKALDDGADFNQVVNVRLKASGLSEAGVTLVRAGRPTPAGIYRASTSREDALARLQSAGYLH